MRMVTTNNTVTKRINIKALQKYLFIEGVEFLNIEIGGVVKKCVLLGIERYDDVGAFILTVSINLKKHKIFVRTKITDSFGKVLE